MRLLTKSKIIAKTPIIINAPDMSEKHKFVVNINGVLTITPHNPPSSITEIRSARKAIDTRSIAAGNIHLTQKLSLLVEKWYKIE